MGRPLIVYDPEIGKRIVTLYEEGMTIQAITALPWCPSWETLRRWRHENPDFTRMFADAREASAEALEQQIIAIAMTAVDKDTAAAARVQVQALQWIAAKRSPKVFGDKLELSGSLDVGIADAVSKARERAAQPELVAVDGKRTA